MKDKLPFGSIRQKPEVDKVIEAAQKETGLTTFGEGSLWKQSIQVYFDDLWSSKLRYNSLKRMIAFDMAKEFVIKRLRVLNALKENFEIEEEVLPRPIFIVGVQRTGSTILHQMLGSDSRAMAIPYWKWDDPIPPTNMETKVEKTKEKVGFVKKLFPVLETMHLTEATEVDECYQGWIDFAFPVEAGAKLYPGVDKLPKLFWNSDLTEVYRNEKRVLQMLQWQDTNSYEWMVLKTTLHTISMDSLINVFPESTFIWTHRDMTDVVCSFLGMFALSGYFGYAYTPLEELVAAGLEVIKDTLYRGLEKRRKLESMGYSFIDFYYNDFIEDPITAISTLYSELGITLPAMNKIQIQNYYQKSLEERRQARKPTRFSLSDFGLQKRQIDDIFETYYSDFPMAQKKTQK